MQARNPSQCTRQKSFTQFVEDAALKNHCMSGNRQILAMTGNAKMWHQCNLGGQSRRGGGFLTQFGRKIRLLQQSSSEVELPKIWKMMVGKSSPQIPPLNLVRLTPGLW